MHDSLIPRLRTCDSSGSPSCCALPFADADALGDGPGNDTLDLILTSDAADRLILAGRVLTGAGTVQAITYGVSVWTDTSVPASVVLHMLDAARAKLTIAGSGSTVIVRDFASGDLSITMPVANAPPVAPPVAPALPGSGAAGTNRSTTYRATDHTVIEATALGAVVTTASGTYGEVWGNGQWLGNGSDTSGISTLDPLGDRADVCHGGSNDCIGGVAANDERFWQERQA